MRELFRQVIHLLFGLGIAAMLMLLDRNTVIWILAAGLLVGVILVDLILRGSTIPGVSWLLGYVDRADPLPGKGALFFVISALVCAIIFPVNIVVPALVTLAVLDSVATLAGRRFGRNRFANKKSLEGTIAGITITAIILLLFITPAGALVVSCTAGVLELLSPVDDNLVIPPGVCMILAWLPVLV